MPDALAACVGDTDAFDRDARGRAPHRHRADDRLTELFGLADADRALTGHGLRRPALRLIADGDPVAASEWTTTARTGNYRVEDLVDGRRALAALANGTTVVFQSLQRWWPPLTEFCQELEGDLGQAVQANAYLTPPNASGLTPHHDTHDVLIVQTHGTKSWTIREPIVEAPLKRQPSDLVAAADQPVIDTFDLAVGDCLYLPRGWIHSASATTGMSLHITIGLLERTALDVVSDAIDRAAADTVELRRSVAPGTVDRDGDRKVIAAAITALQDMLGALDVDDLLEREQRRFALRRRPPLGGQLLDLDEVDQVDETTVVRVADPTSWVLDLVDDRAQLRRSRHLVDLPRAVAPTLRHLLDSAEVRVGDLDRLTSESRITLVKRLVRDGFLTIVK